MEFKQKNRDESWCWIWVNNECWQNSNFQIKYCLWSIKKENEKRISIVNFTFCKSWTLKMIISNWSDCKIFKTQDLALELYKRRCSLPEMLRCGDIVTLSSNVRTVLSSGQTHSLWSTQYICTPSQLSAQQRIEDSLVMMGSFLQIWFI